MVGTLASLKSCNILDFPLCTCRHHTHYVVLLVGMGVCQVQLWSHVVNKVPFLKNNTSDVVSLLNLVSYLLPVRDYRVRSLKALHFKGRRKFHLAPFLAHFYASCVD